MADSTIVLVTGIGYKVMKISVYLLDAGANSGVGYAVAKVLVMASPQYHVVMAGRSLDKIKNAAAQIESLDIKGTLSTLLLDVVDEDSIGKAAEEIQQQFGRVDVLINNAGVASQNPNLKKKLEETIKANSIGPVLVTAAFQPLVLKSKQPRILHVTSGLGSMACATDETNPAYKEHYVAYRMSKAALNMFMIENHKELKKQGVKVFGVCPGLVKSNLRGTSEAAISAGGRAVDADVSGYLMLDIIKGRRDSDVGKVVRKGGIWEW